MIFSALYYPASLAKGELIVRDNRFYPGKYSEGLAVWWTYLRKNYPNEQVTLFADSLSPIPWREVIGGIGEPYSWDEGSSGGGMYPCKVHVKVLTSHSGGYFRPMQRNLVEAICAAYRSDVDLFWLDNDCFLNTNILPLVKGYDAAAPSIAHHQMTMDSVCTYISRERLHSLDWLGIDLPSYLTKMVSEGPTDTRMHSLQEGGLYKLFGYGKTRSLGREIELTHLSCYHHFMAFLERNPLDTKEYQELRFMLANLDMERLKGVEMSFHDMDCHADGTGNHP